MSSILDWIVSWSFEAKGFAIGLIYLWFVGWQIIRELMHPGYTRRHFPVSWANESVYFFWPITGFVVLLSLWDKNVEGP